MTEPQPPDHEPREPEPHEHHTLREEIAEAVEHVAEAVEHVPESVRWTVGKLVRLGLLILFSLIVIVIVSTGLYLAHRTKWVAQEIALVLTQTLARYTDVGLSMKDIHGNPLAGFTVVKPSVQFRDGREPPLLSAATLSVNYSMWGLLTGSQREIDVTIDHPVIHLVRGADGGLRLPKWQSSGSSKKTGPQSLRVHLRLTQAEVATPDSDLNVSGADLDCIGWTSPARVEIANLDWARGPYRTRLDLLRAEAAFGDSVAIHVQELRSPELALSARASWAVKSGPKHVVANVERVRWGLLARLFDNKTLDVPGEGHFTVDASGDPTWTGKFSASVDWDSLEGDGGGEFRWNGTQLAVAPLRFESDAGHLNGKLAWSHNGWDLSGDVKDANPEEWEAIKLSGWPAGNLNGWFRFAEDTRPHGSARVDAVLGSSVLADWHADSAWVTVDLPDVRPDSFAVRVSRRGGRMTLHARSQPGGWNGEYTLSQYPLDEWADGRRSGLTGLLTRGSGTVESRDDGFFVTGDLSGERANWIGLAASKWHLPDMRGQLLPHTALSMGVRLTDMTYLGIHFDSTAASLRVGESRVELDSVRAAAGDTVMRAVGHATFGEAGWAVSLTRASLTSSQLNWEAEPPLDIHGDVHDVTFDRLEAHDGAARLSIGGRWAEPGGGYDWHAKARDLDLAKLGLPPEWGLSGQADADLVIDGPSGDPHWKFIGAAQRPGEQGHLADSLSISLDGSRSRLELSALQVGVRGGVLRGHVKAEEMTRAWPDTLTGAGVLRWVTTASRWDGRLEVRTLDLDHLDALAPAAEGVRGTLGADITIHGRPSNPQFDVDAEVDAAAWKEYSADQVALRCTFAERRLEVSSLRIQHGKLVSEIRGHMALDLGLEHLPRVLEEPMSWSIEAPTGDLGIVPQFVPQVGFAAGRFDLHAKVEGTPSHPLIDGAAHVRDGRLRLAAREEVLEGLNADFKISPSGITLDSLTAKQGRKGVVHGRGRVDLDGFALKDYRFDLTLRQFAASEPGLYAVLFNGDFVVTNGPRIHEQTLPMVDGSVHVQRAVILFDFSNQSEMQQIAASTQPLFWTYRIQLDAKDELRWRPPEGDIEFNADLRMEQTPDSLLIFGEMHLIRGTYWFLSNKFTVQTADLIFDNVEGVNPTIDATATTRIDATSPVQNGAIGLEGATTATTGVTHEVTVHIKGRGNAPTIDFSDDKGEWDQSTMLRQLTLGRSGGVNVAGVNVGDPLDSYVTRAINRSLSADMSKVFGGYVNDWSLERDRGGLILGDGEVIATARSQVTGDFALQYSQRVPGLARSEGNAIINTSSTTDLFERDLRAEYRLNRFFFITTDVSQRRAGAGVTTTTTGGPDYNVSLKARWEY
jgi:TamB, inner membrane protein subunit of TAM complex